MPAGTQPSYRKTPVDTSQHVPVAVPAQSLSSSVSLRYLERSPILVRGPITGRHYQFSAAQPVQPVDSRDADALVRTRFFRRDR